jgi:hypothetical protein
MWINLKNIQWIINSQKHSLNIITHVFLALKGLINRFQNFWKLLIFWNLSHKPWHNHIKNYKKIWRHFWRLFKEHSKKYSTKSKWVWFMLSHLHRTMFSSRRNSIGWCSQHWSSTFSYNKHTSSSNINRTRGKEGSTSTFNWSFFLTP